MKSITKEFLEKCQINIDDVYDVEIINNHPDYWYYVSRHKGERKHKWLGRFSGTYNENLIFSHYTNSSIPQTQFLNILSPKHVFHEEEKLYPVWFIDSLHVRWKGHYGNPSSVSTDYYLDTTREELETIVKDINLIIKK